MDTEDVLSSMMKLPAVAQSVTDSLQKQEHEMASLSKQLDELQVRLCSSFIFFKLFNYCFSRG